MVVTDQARDLGVLVDTWMRTSILLQAQKQCKGLVPYDGITRKQNGNKTLGII